MDVLSQVLAAARTGTARSETTIARPHFTLEYPARPVAGFHVVLHGRARVRLAGDPVGSGAQLLRAGDVVLLPHGAAHFLASGGDDTDGDGVTMLCGRYDLDARTPHPLLADLPELMVVNSADVASLDAVIGLLTAEVSAEPSGTHTARTALVELVLVLLLRRILADADAAGSGFGAALHDPRLGPALRAVHAHPEHPWTVTSLAAHAGLSRSAFARRFTDLVGIPPQTYVLRWRMGLAATLLRGGDAPLVTIARQVGYTSPFAFSRAFTRDRGMSPSRWRAGVGGDVEPVAAVAAGDAARR